MNRVTTERDLLRQSIAALVEKHAPLEAVRRAMASLSGYDEKLWRLLCEVGAAALVVPEEFGGAGGELADAAVVLEELGRSLVPTPLLGTVLAELALLASHTPDADDLEALAAGESIGAVVFDPDYVVNGDCADVVVSVADGRVHRWTEFTIEPFSTLDPTRRLTEITPGSSTPIGTDPGIADLAAILLAAEQIGAATRCLELTVDYTKQRVQFGRPIGSFQALKHRMADLYVAVESARAVVGDAIADPTPVTAALARLAATEAFCMVAGEGIQLHGGIAITWEHDMHLYFKRAHCSAQLLGPPREQVRRLEGEIL
jgi:alkylation response protein AidB-like acyl-CoA dehydrogenase